jgi:hypothetical protein
VWTLDVQISDEKKQYLKVLRGDLLTQAEKAAKSAAAF